MIPPEVIAQMASLGLDGAQAAIVASMLHAVELATIKEVMQPFEIEKARQGEEAAARVANKRQADRERQRRHRLSRVTSRDNALSRVTSLPKKERVPPTPPLQEKTPSLFPSSADADEPPTQENPTELVDWFEGQWNALADRCGLARIRAMTDKRMRAIRCRADDLVTALGFADPRAGFAETFNRIRGSPFLRGAANGARAWRCDVDWLLTESNFLKVHEGKYAQEQKSLDRRHDRAARVL